MSIFYTSPDGTQIAYDCAGNPAVYDALIALGGRDMAIAVVRHVPRADMPGWTDHIPETVSVVALPAALKSQAQSAIEAALAPPKVVVLPRAIAVSQIFAFHRTSPPIPQTPALRLPDGQIQWVTDFEGQIALSGLTILYSSMRVFKQGNQFVRHGNLVVNGMFPPGTQPVWRDALARVLPLSVWEQFHSRWYEAPVAQAWHG